MPAVPVAGWSAHNQQMAVYMACRLDAGWQSHGTFRIRSHLEWTNRVHCCVGLPRQVSASSWFLTHHVALLQTACMRKRGLLESRSQHRHSGGHADADSVCNIRARPCSWFARNSKSAWSEFAGVPLARQQYVQGAVALTASARVAPRQHAAEQRGCGDQGQVAPLHSVQGTAWSTPARSTHCRQV